MAVCRKPLSILTEYVDGGSLFDLLHTRDRCPPVLPVMRQAAGALAYMHAVDVVHRDVKSQNVLLTKGMLAKLCDFGLARMRYLLKLRGVCLSSPCPPMWSGQ